MRYHRGLLSALLWTSFSFSALVHAQQSCSYSFNRPGNPPESRWPSGPRCPTGKLPRNPWTPPTRTQCGSTISSGASSATINAALAACSTGTYVLLGPGTFTFASTNLTMYAQNGVTLRGSGAQSTKIVLTGTAYIDFGIVWNNGSCSWTSGYSPGTTSLTMNGCSGPALVAGEIIYLKQCDTGYSGSGCSTGSATDNGGLFVCGAVGSACSQQTRSDAHQNQVQAVYVNSISCSSSCTVSFSPGLYLPNWSSGQTPVVTWGNVLIGGEHCYSLRKWPGRPNRGRHR